MTDTDLIEQAKEIIATGCSCDRLCEREDFCGCKDEAEQIVRLVRQNDAPLS
jgi:hypothetical protein